MERLGPDIAVVVKRNEEPLAGGESQFQMLAIFQLNFANFLADQGAKRVARASVGKLMVTPVDSDAGIRKGADARAVKVKFDVVHHKRHDIEWFADEALE
jgi:hypothetical protein